LTTGPAIDPGQFFFERCRDGGWVDGEGIANPIGAAKKIKINPCRIKNFWQSLQRHHDPSKFPKNIQSILFPILFY
jgi:hypothetical protein